MNVSLSLLAFVCPWAAALSHGLRTCPEGPPPGGYRLKPASKKTSGAFQLIAFSLLV